MQEFDSGENSAAPDHFTDSKAAYLSRLYEVVQLTNQQNADGHALSGVELERDARVGLKVLTEIEEMPFENIAMQREFLCSLLFHTAKMLDHHDLRIFAGRVMEKIFEIDPDYLPTEPASETTDAGAEPPNSNYLLDTPDL